MSKFRCETTNGLRKARGISWCHQMLKKNTLLTHMLMCQHAPNWILTPQLSRVGHEEAIHAFKLEIGPLDKENYPNY